MSKSKLNSSGYRIQEQFSEEVARERKSFQPLIEKAIKDEKQFFVKFNKLIIDNIVYMSDYEDNTVKPVSQMIKKLGVGKATVRNTSFRGEIDCPECVIEKNSAFAIERNCSA